MQATHRFVTYSSALDVKGIIMKHGFSPDGDKEAKRTSLAKAYRNLMQNMWSEDPPSSIAPTSVLYAVKLVSHLLYNRNHSFLNIRIVRLTRHSTCFVVSNNTIPKSSLGASWINCTKN